MAIGTGAAIGHGLAGSSLLRGGGGGGGGDVEQVSTLRPGQEDLLDELTTYLQGKVGTGMTPFPGMLTPGQTEFGEGGLAALGRLTTVDPEAIESRWREQKLPLYQRILEQDVLPGLSEQFVQSGFQGSPRMSALTGARERFGDVLMSELSGEISRAEQLALPAAQFSLQLEQIGIDRELQEFMRTQPELSPLLPIILAAVGTQGMDIGVTDPSPSPFAGLLSGFGTGLGGQLAESLF